MKNTYFYEKPDGVIFACEDEEASITGSKYKQIGVSDGSLFNEMMKDIQRELASIEREIKLKFETGSVPTEEQLLKKREVIERFNQRYKESFNAEVERSRGNLVEPPDFSGKDEVRKMGGRI